MKKIFVLLAVCLLSSCNVTNSDGSSVFTYSSCKITDSNAPFRYQQQHDEKQCWNAKADGYTSKSRAVDWCDEKVHDYVSEKYPTNYTVEFKVESTYCK
ncbi:hypothetical protein [Vibrio neonatus]|uniref:hypothetical protein n=1 Tax=Vibrio neonatus TaxID=278860 RepID=UPI0021C30F9C|nr:hypothetical protein [Vibrio neonatus]